MDVLMPQLGETVSEGKITKWFKSAGDAVKPGDNLFEIETDKVSMEVPSTTTGVLAEIRVVVGAVAPVGAIVAVIADTAGAAASPPPRIAQAPAAPVRAAAVPAAVAPAVTAPAASAAPIKLDPFFEVRTPARNYGPAKLSGGGVVTPLARRLAGEAGIDLARLTGSGPHGRIVARDIESAAALGVARGAAPAVAPAGPTAEQVMALYRDLTFEEVPLDGMRRTIATRLVQAKQTIPHFYLTADLDIGRLLALRGGGECGGAGGSRRQSGAAALGQRFHHQGLGGGAAAHPGRQCGVGGRPRPAFQAFRYRGRGRDRGRAHHAGDPAGREQDREHDLGRDARARGTCAHPASQAA